MPHTISRIPYMVCGIPYATYHVEVPEFIEKVEAINQSLKICLVKLSIAKSELRTNDAFTNIV